MVQPLANDSDPRCSVCGKPATVFGKAWPQRFFSEDTGGFLCLDCARATVPSQVRFAEAWEAEAARRQERNP